MVDSSRITIWPTQKTRVGKNDVSNLNLISEGRLIEIIVLWVRNNVGIDFAELEPTHGSKPGGTTQVAQKRQGV